MPTRSLELGAPIRRGASGIAKRLAAFERHVELHGDRLLDVGCGNGAYTVVMSEKFRQTIGIDLEAERLRQFGVALTEEQHARISISRMSASRMALPSESFDFVTAIEVIEHVDELEDALSEMVRVLKPGGKLCIACPNRLFPIETHMVNVPFTSRDVPGHWFPFLPWVPPLHRRLSRARTFVASELTAIMHRHGLERLAIDYIMPPFDGWTFGRRVLKPVTEWLERTPFQIFGVSLIGIFQKP